MNNCSTEVQKFKNKHKRNSLYESCARLNTLTIFT